MTRHIQINANTKMYRVYVSQNGDLSWKHCLWIHCDRGPPILHTFRCSWV